LIQKGKEWVSGKVIEKLKFPPRSYVVQDKYGQTYRRNRIMLRKCYSKTIQSDYSDFVPKHDVERENVNIPNGNENQNVVQRPNVGPDRTVRPHGNEIENVVQRPNVGPDRPVQNQTSRFGRVIRKPSHLNDFV
jgi:hypothetical protein